ncbi:DUF4407 domain-containing protein [Hymenobacter sp. BT18]|uniref:DUF4407 domain-containing protein n=1 Tax=Hymenobacter sp. BT18 TaxID=2835648 RepID=UPI00143E21B8|nr:DUF4407 domain-containing protein [Hymenobacter sp. BT18]QIX62722.1 DUF4407 domain-containing protein [Hymenobacter sp. BT18]
MNYSALQYLCWLFSGAEISLLKECPTDYNRQASIGFTIFMTCLLAALSGGFAAWTFTLDPTTHEGNWVASVIFGLVWGLLVFSIDRSMVVTLKKNPTVTKQPFFIPLVTRMLLAGLLAFMISIPLELKIFEPEIEKQALEDIQNSKLKYGGTVEKNSGINDAEARKKAEAERAKLANQQLSMADSQVPGVPALIAEAETQESIARDKEKEGQNQATVVDRARAKTYVQPHTDASTGKWIEGYFSRKGPAARKYQEAKAVYNKINVAANLARNKAGQLRSEARKKADNFRADAAKNQNDALTASQKAEIEREKIQARNDSINSVYDKQLNKRGFISQFVSMENAAHDKDNMSMLFFLWFIRILFFVIEILPTIVKLATPIGEYDHQLYTHEQMFALALKTNLNILKDRELVREQAELNIATQLEQIRKDKEIELGQKILEQTAAIQNSLAKQMLNDWHKSEKDKQKTLANISFTSNLSVAPTQNTVINNPTNSLNYNNASTNTIQSSPQAYSAALNDEESTKNIQSAANTEQSNVGVPNITQTKTEHVSNSSLDPMNISDISPSIFGRKWHLKNSTSPEIYYFQNSGSQLNTLIREQKDSDIRQIGRWQHPQGDSSRLHIEIENNLSSFKITHLTDKNLQLSEDNGTVLNFEV